MSTYIFNDCYYIYGTVKGEIQRKALLMRFLINWLRNFEVFLRIYYRQIFLYLLKHLILCILLASKLKGFGESCIDYTTFVQLRGYALTHLKV